MSASFEEKSSLKAEFPCAVPTIDSLNIGDHGINLARILGSHEWCIDKIDYQGMEKDSILLQIHCKNCGLQRISIISDINDSAVRARQYRASCSK